MLQATGLPPIYSREGLALEMYDVICPPPPLDSGEVALFRQQAEVTGDPILEIACGTGRVAWSLAQAGHTVTGLDLNAPMLRRAEAKASGHAAEVRARTGFVAGDMRAFDLGQTFGLIICTFRSFMALLTPADQRAALGAMRRHLRPGGRLVLDLFDPQLDRLLPRNAYAPRFLGAHPHPLSGHRVVWESIDHHNDPVDQILQEVWRWTEVDEAGRVLRQEIEELTLRWTYRYELHLLLEVSGYRVLQEHADFDGAPPAYGRELVVIAITDRTTDSP